MSKIVTIEKVKEKVVTEVEKTYYTLRLTKVQAKVLQMILGRNVSLYGTAGVATIDIWTELCLLFEDTSFLESIFLDRDLATRFTPNSLKLVEDWANKNNE